MDGDNVSRGSAMAKASLQWAGYIVVKVYVCTI